MKIYWTLDMIPEMKEFPKEERGRIWRRNSYKALKHWQSWASLLVIPLEAIPALEIWVKNRDLILGNLYMYPLFILPLVLFVLGGIIIGSVLVEQVRPYLREYKGEYDHKHEVQ